MKCGIVGLPNVGKSTLFNALTATIAAEAANYPFCTIEPNYGIVAVPDSRLNLLAEIAGSQKIIPTKLEIYDIAGLVKGASKGEGLGNQFLGHIREVDAIIHVLRCYEDPNIVHVHGKIDPVSDAEVIETELMIADYDSIEKRIPAIEKKIKTGDKLLVEQLELLLEIKDLLSKGLAARTLIKNDNDYKRIKPLNLLTSKPILYVCNVNERDAFTGNEYTEKVKAFLTNQDAQMTIISSKIESEIANLSSEEEKKDFLNSIGIEETGLNKIIKAGFGILNLKSYFTVGPKEARAWAFKDGISAPEAAGIIHTDFEKGFIRAEIISYEDMINYKGEAAVKEAGKMRLEGKDYKVKDGDIIHFRFNV